MAFYACLGAQRDFSICRRMGLLQNEDTVLFGLLYFRAENIFLIISILVSPI